MRVHAERGDVLERLVAGRGVLEVARGLEGQRLTVRGLGGGRDEQRACRAHQGDEGSEASHEDGHASGTTRGPQRLWSLLLRVRSGRL